MVAEGSGKVSDVDLKIAELLAKGWSYREIQRELGVYPKRIANAKRMMERGEVKVGGDGGAYRASEDADELPPYAEAFKLFDEGEGPSTWLKLGSCRQGRPRRRTASTAGSSRCHRPSRQPRS